MFTKKEEEEIKANALRSIKTIEESCAKDAAILALSGFDGLLRARKIAIDHDITSKLALVDALGVFIYGEKWRKEVGEKQ